MKVKGFYFYLDVEQRDKLRILSFKTGETMSKILREAIREYFNKPENKNRLDGWVKWIQ